MRYHFSAESAAITVVLILSGFLVENRDVSAAGEQPPGPDRYVTVTQEYTKYIWWLAKWSDSLVDCQIEVDHEGLPSYREIYNACGEAIYDQWIASPQCEDPTGDPGSCSGYYFQFYQEESDSREVPVQLLSPVVWVTLDGCIPYASTHRCDDSPILVLRGEEPQSGYSIIRLEGTVDETPFSCDPICQLDLSPTDEDGLLIRFWAYSSYGDSSEIFTARVRVRSKDDQQEPYLFVDVISTQWRGSPQAPCMQVWNIFPPVGGVRAWLSTPDSPSELISDIPYEYLAGNLISHGAVDAGACSDKGLLDNGYASACGLDIARSAVTEWQNRFDNFIFTSAQEMGIPAQLLKNIFSRESQFWPGTTPEHLEAGLGQLTDNGADTTLLWNRPFYEQFCSGVLENSICQKGYPHLTDEHRAILRDALVRSVDAYSADCDLGIDIRKAEVSVSIFAETLLANCAQTGMVLDLNYTNNGYPPAYEDLWRFTLVNYNAGPGCLGLAVNKTSTSGEPLDWEHVSSHLTSACQGAKDYVTDISIISP